jgi:hypothetical protein
MSRRSVLLATGILLLLGVFLVAGGAVLLRHEPAFYRRAALSSGAARKKNWDDFKRQCSALHNGIQNNREWSAQFAAEQINGYLQEMCRAADGEDRTLPDGIGDPLLPERISDPRIAIEDGRLRLGFRYGSGIWSTVVSIDLRVWVAKGEPNVVGLELQGMHAGSLPLSSQSLLEHVSEAARRQNVEVTWYRYQGNPVALLRFQNRRSRATVQLTQVELQAGKLLIQGRSVDAGRAAGN